MRLAHVVPVEEMLSDDAPYREMQSMGTELMLVDWPGPVRAVVLYKGERPTLEDLVPIYRKVLASLLDLTEHPPCTGQTVH